jgi:hypothetical protein
MAAIFQGGFNALAALLHGDIRQADDVEIARFARADFYLDLHEVCVDAEHSCAEVFEMHLSPEVTIPMGARSTKCYFLTSEMRAPGTPRRIDLGAWE